MNKTFLETLRNKLKSGNLRSVHLNALPGRYATRLDLANLDYVKSGFANEFLEILLTQANFEFKISFADINLNSKNSEEQKKLNLLAKRLNSITIENEDYYKEHGIKTFGFGYPLLIKPSKKDPGKIIKSPLFIWPLEIIKATNKVNTWSILRNKIRNEAGNIINADVHSPALNEVLLSSIKADENINIAQINEELLEDMIIDKRELIEECERVLKSLNANVNQEELKKKFNEPLTNIPEAKYLENITNQNGWIYFGGVFGLFRTQKESIISDIDKLIENYDEFEWNDLKIEKFSGTTYSAIETDPSQQEILATLGTATKKIIQGPPGTGKSQSLTAILVNAMANKLRCLVVCEKKTALDVIKKNLSDVNEQIGSLAVVIDDLNKDRDAVVESVRNRFDAKNTFSNVNANEIAYENTIKKIDLTVKEINKQHKLLDEKIYQGKTWAELVGEFLKLQRKYECPKQAFDHKRFKFKDDETELDSYIDKIKTAKRLYMKLNTMNHPLEILSTNIFKQKTPTIIQYELMEFCKDMQNQIETSNNKYEKIFYKNDVLSYIRINLLKLFLKKYKDMERQYENIVFSLNDKKYFEKTYKNSSNHKEKILEIEKIIGDLNAILKNSEDFADFFYWKKFYIAISALEQTVIKSLIKLNPSDWENTFKIWYYNWLLASEESEELPNNEVNILELIDLKKQLKEKQLSCIVKNWTAKQGNSVEKMQNTSIKSLYNKRGTKGERRNSLRKIINKDFDLFTNYFPIVMLSPTVCSSLIPLKEKLFDIVIFDESSQLRLEDSFAALIRGKIKIVSGDSQQMPPSNFFQGNSILIEPTAEDEDADDGEHVIEGINNSKDLASSESLLVYAENSNYTQSYLNVHYRSQHPDLIQFSNNAFYGGRLIPMPAKKEYTPIHFIEVNGIYHEQVNEAEAEKVIDILLNIQPFENSKYPSIGVATFNIFQRNLILEKISKYRLIEKYSKKITDLEQSGLFVKNLENIQGDERDIIIISTTFGKKEDNSFRQNFGPITQSKGYKLLNVIITRAKHEIFVCTSIPQECYNSYVELLKQKKNTGSAIFYAYLAYSKAISENNIDVKESLLKQLLENCEAKVMDTIYSLGSESPFEEEVYCRLADEIGEDRLEQQYRIGGFRIDIVVKSKLDGKPIIAIECDGAKYHSSNEAYAWDMFRQEQLEKHGLIFHRIWSTNWWNSSEKELEKLILFINEHS
jgi:very-short-patch-repair endonuclease